MVKGYRGRGGGLAFLTFLIVSAAALGAAYAVSVGLFHHELSSGAIAGALSAGVVSAVAIPRRASNKPWELAIPWRSVVKVTVHAQRKDVQVKIKKHRPRGTLHFMPTNAATQTVVEAITTHLARGAASQP